jgi:hypothetical protein
MLVNIESVFQNMSERIASGFEGINDRLQNLDDKIEHSVNRIGVLERHKPTPQPKILPPPSPPPPPQRTGPMRIFYSEAIQTEDTPRLPSPRSALTQTFRSRSQANTQTPRSQANTQTRPVQSSSTLETIWAKALID